MSCGVCGRITTFSWEIWVDTVAEGFSPSGL